MVDLLVWGGGDFIDRLFAAVGNIAQNAVWIFFLEDGIRPLLSVVD